MHNLRYNGKTLCWSLLGTGVQTPSTRVLSALRSSRPSPKQGYIIEVNRVPKRCEVIVFLLFSAHLGNPYFSAPRRLCIDCIEIDVFFIVWTSKLSVLPQHRQFCEQ